MEIKTKYSLKDKVWYIRKDHCEVTIACKICNDTKEVILTGEKFKCPNCVTKCSSRYRERWYVVGESLIGKLQYSLEIKMGQCNYDYDDETTEQRKEIKEEITYMLTDTGIGSGLLWNEKFLFSSMEEAQKVCDANNELILAEEIKYHGN